MKQTRPNPAFIHSVAKNLEFWTQKLVDLSEFEVAQLYGDKDNLVQAIRFGLRIPETREAASKLALDAFHFVDRAGYQREWTRILEAIETKLLPLDPDLRIAILNRLGQLYRHTGQYDEAVIYHEQAQSLAKQHGKELEYGIACWQVGADYRWLNRLDSAETVLNEALSVLREVDEHRLWLPAAMNELGILHERRGNFERAEQLWREAYAIYLENGKVVDANRIVRNLILLLARTKRFDECDDFIAIVSAELADKRLVTERAMMLLTVGAAYAQQEEWQRAETVFRTIDIDPLIRAGQTDWAASTVVNLGIVLARQQRYEEAEGYLREGLRLAQEYGDDIRVVSAAINLGDVLAAQQNYQAALDYYDVVERYAGKYPEHSYFTSELAEALASRSRVQMKLQSGDDSAESSP
ncbi:MAG: tetratricopeptide repeat protein [Anaerolineae bacterium]|nr:tetratricopeptide repeat protein [Anaerolineae bacterium]